MKTENRKIILYAAIGIFLLFLIFSSFGVINIKNIWEKGSKNYAGGDYSSLPEECRKPEGQDIDSWKEHLGHHQNTLYCLDYYK